MIIKRSTLGLMFMGMGIFMFFAFISNTYPVQAQVAVESCSSQKECGGGLRCISFPEGARCAKLNPCSYYQCPQGTQCFVNINVGATGSLKATEGAIPVQNQPSSQLQLPEIMQAPFSASGAQNESGKSAVLESKPTNGSVSAPMKGEEQSYGGGLPGDIGIIGIPPTKNTDAIRVGCRALADQAVAVGAPAEKMQMIREAQEFELIYSSPIERSLGGYSLGGPEILHTGGGGVGGASTPGVSNTVEIGKVTGPIGRVSVGSPNFSPAPISVWKAKSGEKTIIQAQSASAEYIGGAVTVENNQLTIQTPQGSQTIEAMPDVAMAQVQEAEKGAEITKVELKADVQTGVPGYQVSSQKSARLFGLIPVTVKAETNVSAKTGEIISVERPWWKVFAW